MWLKIVGFLSTIIAILGAVIGYKNNKIDNLEDENEGLIKKDQIKERQQKANIKAEDDEKESSENINTDDWRTKI